MLLFKNQKGKKHNKAKQNQDKIQGLPDIHRGKVLLNEKFQIWPLRNSMGLKPLSDSARFLETPLEISKLEQRAEFDLRSPKIEY